MIYYLQLNSYIDLSFGCLIYIYIYSAWSIWIYRANVIFDVQPDHIINLAVNLFENMRYYNFISGIFVRMIVQAPNQVRRGSLIRA